MKRFKWLRSVHKTYDAQALIFYTCMNYDEQPEAIRRKIRKVAQRAAEEYADALLEFLTTQADFRYVCTKYSISDRTLERIRRRFYAMW